MISVFPALVAPIAAAFFFFSTLALAADVKTVSLACNEFPPHKINAAPGELPGFDVEILRESFARSGISPEIEFLPWKRAMQEVQTGKIDGLCSCSQHPDRDSWLVYSDPLGTVGVGSFYRSDIADKVTSDWNLPRDLSVGVVRAYNLQSELAAAGLKPILVKDDTHGLRMMIKGRLDVFVTFRDTGEYILAQDFSGHHFSYRGVRKSDYYACFGKRNPDARALADIFNKGLSSMIKDGTRDRIIAKYK